MRARRWSWLALATALAAASAHADPTGATGLGVEVWTDRGNDAVYQPGDVMQVQVRASEGGFLLAYEIDAEGAVRVLWPERGSNGWIEGGTPVAIPSEHSNLELVVEPQTGQSFVVAIVSRQPFLNLPWYLRPYDPQAEGSGYAGEPDDEQGVTREGRIVGDPFVAMERIRRRVLQSPDDPESFGTAYTAYYTHERVLYPRYLCSDCHRPGYWAWWDGFDPYYAECPVFEFRVNWGWYWGPSYWFGTVPYYYYAIRPNCPPRYGLYPSHGVWFSAWNGWHKWHGMMGGSVRHSKHAPPPNYRPPSRYNDPLDRPRQIPPGFLASRVPATGRHGGALRPTVDAGRPSTAAGRVERPPEVWRGALERGGDPGRGRADDSETRGESRGIPERRGGFKWVAPGQGGIEPRPAAVRAPIQRDRGGDVAPRRPEARAAEPRAWERERPRAGGRGEESRSQVWSRPRAEPQAPRREEARPQNGGRNQQGQQGQPGRGSSFGQGRGGSGRPGR